MKNAYFYETRLGKIMIVEDSNQIIKLLLIDEFYDCEVMINETEGLKQAGKQLLEYLDGKRIDFTIPLNAEGTDFQKRVWDKLREIPYGETRSYKQIAEAIGNPKASRAVGMANNRNPIMLMIPCHRVIGSNGSLVGYAGGLPLKEALLKLEKELERK